MFRLSIVAAVNSKKLYMRKAGCVHRNMLHPAIVRARLEVCVLDKPASSGFTSNN